MMKLELREINASAAIALNCLAGRGDAVEMRECAEEDSMSGRKNVVIAALIAVPFATSALAQEYFETKEPSGGAMMYDLIVLRPVGAVATVIGSVVWLVSLPFSAAGDNSEVATTKLVKEPAKFTFKRPLGEF